MRSCKIFTAFLFIFFIIVLCTACEMQGTKKDSAQIAQPSSVKAVPSTDYSSIERRITQRCEEIVSLYYDLYICAEKNEPESPWDEPTLQQSSIDAIESLLIENSLDVIDTNGAYPEYLTTADHFQVFWTCVQRKEDSEQEIISIAKSGALNYRLFSYQDGIPYVYFKYYPMDNSSNAYFEPHRVLDWELTEKGNFFYRIYPANDKHYADYSLIRMNAPDLTLYDMTMKYIWAGDYMATNIFLVDWTEDDFESLCFNDLWDAFYYDCYGQQFDPDGYDYEPERRCYMIPSAQFEEIVLPYFNIELDAFRQMAQYDAEKDGYPWRKIVTNDLVFLYYYSCEPEVSSYRANDDGTLTLTVEAISTDLKLDCLFAHEVTVRPLKDGSFQFVGNKVTYQTEYGLPFCESRLSWDPSWS